MTNEELLAHAQELLQAYITDWTQPEANRLDGILQADALLEAVSLLKNAQWGYLAAITGLDYGASTGRMELLYHLCESAAVLSLRVSLPREHPTIASICEFFPYASPYEREVAEMFGIEFIGTLDTSRLFLPDDWTEALYPLRKDADLKEADDG